jgi:hypothetical protein
MAYMVSSKPHSKGPLLPLTTMCNLTVQRNANQPPPSTCYRTSLACRRATT